MSAQDYAEADRASVVFTHLEDVRKAAMHLSDPLAKALVQKGAEKLAKELQKDRETVNAYARTGADPIAAARTNLPSYKQLKADEATYKASVRRLREAGWLKRLRLGTKKNGQDLYSFTIGERF